MFAERATRMRLVAGCSRAWDYTANLNQERVSSPRFFRRLYALMHHICCHAHARSPVAFQTADIPRERWKYADMTRGLEVKVVGCH